MLEVILHNQEINGRMIQQQEHGHHLVAKLILLQVETMSLQVEQVTLIVMTLQQEVILTQTHQALHTLVRMKAVVIAEKAE